MVRLVPPVGPSRPTTSNHGRQVDKDAFCSILDEGLSKLRSYLVHEFANHFGDGSCFPNGSYHDVIVRTPIALTPMVEAGAGSSNYNGVQSYAASTGSSNHKQSCATSTNGCHTPSGVYHNSGPSHTSGIAHIGADQNNFVPTLDDAILTPLDRWARVCELLLQPKIAITKQSKLYHMHECWSTYFRKLVHNEGNCQVGFEIAMQKVIAAHDVRPGRLSTASARTSTQTANYNLDGHSHSFKSYGHTSSFSSDCPVPYVFIDPSSTFYRIWVAMVFLVLCCDAFVLPIQAAFDAQNSGILAGLLWFGTIFWAVDIILNFLAGRYNDMFVAFLYEERYLCRCLTSRIIVDIVLVLIDCVVLVIIKVVESDSVGSIGFTLRSCRIVRLVRLVRLIRFQTLMHDAFALKGRSVLAFAGVLKVTLCFFIYVHLLACLWYAIGRANHTGWVNTCEKNDNPDVDCYLAALYWAMTQTHGTSTLELNTRTESIFSTCAVFIGFLFFAFLLGKIVDATAKVMGVEKLEMRQRCADLASRRNLSRGVARRVMRVIDTSDAEFHLDRIVEQERDVLSILPVSLQAEVLEEMRRPLLGVSILRDLKCVSSKMSTQLCSESIKINIIAESDVVFSLGDQGIAWRIIDIGVLRYSKRNDDMWEKVVRAIGHDKNRESGFGISMDIATLRERCGLFRKMPTRGTSGSIISNASAGSILLVNQTINQQKRRLGTSRTLARTSTISEMVLWTPWVHTGDLDAVKDCVLLQLTMEDFHSVVKARMDTCLLAARYAQQYVKRLTQFIGSISDLFQNTEDLANESYADYSSRDATQHHIFLSHFKEEAGTEATLMQVGLASLMDDTYEADMQLNSVASIFLDSENLTDLSGLQEHVINSKNLVVLLTPGILHRPWCLVEIVTACIHDVQIVPVEIQRPGMKFEYPGEDFYARLRSGAELSPKDISLLSVEGISLGDVEDAIRYVFTQIALPFSPHKSKNVRDAELSDIMRRCSPNNDADTVRTWVPNLSQKSSSRTCPSS